LDIVGAEAASIFMARAIGIPITYARIEHSLGRKALLTQRFDRLAGGERRMVVSATTMLGVPETMMPIGGSPVVLDVLREDGISGQEFGKQLFERIAFNIAISNTDDHLRNHAAFWSGEHLVLTPAYDLSPVSRSGDTSRQVLAYGRNGERDSNFAAPIDVCETYDLGKEEASELVDTAVHTMQTTWDEAADFAELTTVGKATLWGHQFLHRATMYTL